jgi:hypothetical protein
MIRYQKYTKAQAEAFFARIDSKSDPAFTELLMQWENHSLEQDFDKSYEDLRKKVIEVFDEYKNVSDYEVDLRVGLCLFENLNAKEDFDYIRANDDDIWRYLSCVVFPDITNKRYAPTEKDREANHRLNSKRFYSHTRRIWVKTLWWYIYLAWQGSVEKTYEVLKDCGTDTISDFIERPGKGYRLELFRALMKEYSRVEHKSSDLFNSIQKLNLVNCKTIEPALSEGKETGYSKRLIKQLI